MTDNRDTAIRVSHLVKSFKIPTEAHNGIKQKLINLLRGVKGYRKFTPLDDISFEIKKGEFFGIVGRNGSGKSTLLKSIANIYSPDSGTIYVNGKLIPFIELGVGFNPELTGRENVFLNGALLGFSNREMEAMYDEIVDFAELHDFMEEKLKNYSSGMQVRLAFSIAIRAEGDILLLDEVLAVGDAAFQQKCYDYFEEIKREKRTVILVTHSMDAVKRFCNQALLLENGSVKKIGKPEEIADQYLIDNIAKIEQSEDENLKTRSSEQRISATINKNNFFRNESLIVNYDYKLAEDMDVVLGLVIVQNGVSVAEINSLDIKLPGKKGVNSKAILSVVLQTLNPGEYSMNVSIMNRDNMGLVDYKLNAQRFIINGNDQTRGSAAYLEGSWSVD